MGRRKHLPVLENIEITDVAAEGKSIARHEGMVVFVRQTVPGDVVDVQLVRKRKNYAEGYPVRYRKYAENRVDPFCQHFGICGGCIWQHLPYDDQLSYKQKQVLDNLTRIAKVDVGIMDPIVASAAQTGYRNKLEFTFSSKRWLTPDEIRYEEVLEDRRALGFHIPGRFDKVFDVKTCYLQPEPSNTIRNFVREYCVQNKMDFFDLRTQEGFLRNLIIRNTTAGDFMVIVSFYRDEPVLIEGLMDAIAAKFTEIKSLFYVINDKANDTLNGLEMIHCMGTDFLEEVMEDMTFRISPRSFFQTNPKQAYRLYCIVRDFAGLTGNETVYDLYTGTGTISLFLARHCKRVVGIDYVEESIADARLNAILNKTENASFFAGDIRVLLHEDFFTQHGSPDVIITDPPRTGMHADVIQSMLAAAPDRIVYVSCNPATQARDIGMLSPYYQVIRSRPVDMFPHTAHVENVALLRRIVEN